MPFTLSFSFSAFSSATPLSLRHRRHRSFNLIPTVLFTIISSISPSAAAAHIQLNTMLVPPWLEPLLNASFFSVCRIHGDAARSECNMYCLDCNGDPFCFYCRSSRHKDHQVIQIRRSSYHDVVRVAEIQKVLDIGGVQTYVINSARVLFLNERPQPKTSAGKGGGAHICEICGRSLLDPFRFCSLGCKLAGIKRNGNASFGLGSVSSRQEEELREGSQQDMYPATPPPPPASSARRRKGIPHRAPFAS